MTMRRWRRCEVIYYHKFTKQKKKKKKKKEAREDEKLLVLTFGHVRAADNAWSRAACSGSSRFPKSA